MPAFISRFSLLVADYEEAIAWYRDKLGFSVLEDRAEPAKRWVVISPPGGGCALVLARASTPAQQALIGAQAGERVWLFLQTDDFARDHAAMLAAGVHFCETPRHEAYGTVAVFEDLYGNRWDLLQPA